MAACGAKAFTVNPNAPSVSHYWKSAEYQRERYRARREVVEKCNVCGEEMAHYQLLMHKLSKHRGKYWCEVCRVGVLNIWDHEKSKSHERMKNNYVSVVEGEDLMWDDEVRTMKESKVVKETEIRKTGNVRRRGLLRVGEKEVAVGVLVEV